MPNRLTLKGLAGRAQNRFALINNVTLRAGEEERVRVGASNVVVRCLAIGENSARIHVQGESSPRELCLETR